MGLFSKELEILDRNTVQFMIDEQAKEIAENAKVIEEMNAAIAENSKTIEKMNAEIADKDAEIAELKKLLAAASK